VGRERRRRWGMGGMRTHRGNSSGGGGCCLVVMMVVVVIMVGMSGRRM